MNPYISLEDTSFLIPKERQPWSVGAKRRFAGVSSFGFGGTNAHVILEEPPVVTRTTNDIERPLHLLTLSAKSEDALRSLVNRYQKFLEANPHVGIADVCFTANTGRSHFDHRLAIITESTQQLQAVLDAFATAKQTSRLISGQVQTRNRPKIAFLFTGQGSQYVGMGRRLYETQPSFRQALERCDQLLRSYLDQPLLSLLYSASDNTELLHETAYTQPALFALEYALAELWFSWGVVPDVVMGHSLGEYVAACVAGVFSLEDAIKLVVERSRLMQSLPHDGKMAVVFASEARVKSVLSSCKTPVLNGRKQQEYGVFDPYQTQVTLTKEAVVSIAAVNSLENIVISGTREAVENAIAQLQSQGISVQPLQVSHAFHSPLMTPILDEFERQAAKVQFKAPSIPLISNLTGQMLKPGEIPDANYWRCHLRETVQFAAGMNTLETQDCEVFLELGPSTTLLGMGKRRLPQATASWLPSLKQGQDDWQVILNTLAVLETKGVDVDWAGFDQDYQRCRVPLPTYPFERQRYWLEQNKASEIYKSDRQQQVNITEQIAQKGQSKSKLCEIVARLLQTDADKINVHTPFLEMGADSLVLLEAVQAIENSFGIKITIRQFFEELSTIDDLANYIDRNLTPEWRQKVYPELQVGASESSQNADISLSTNKVGNTVLQGGIATPETALERIIAQQLEVMSQQLQALRESNLVAEKSLPQSWNQTTVSPDNGVHTSDFSRDLENPSPNLSHQFDGSCFKSAKPPNALPPQVGKPAHATGSPTRREALIAPPSLEGNSGPPLN
ncbi:short-chain dehydrogenase/reductase SDR [Nostoc sp. NIES-4103]|nr:short-chain dehydrogenase/reductase SDR [Nostoc sp. NIES-4103]